jgi:hypothetical protein
MKILKIIKHSDIFSETHKDQEKFSIRKAARAVVFDADNKVAILDVTKC